MRVNYVGSIVYSGGVVIWSYFRVARSWPGRFIYLVQCSLVFNVLVLLSVYFVLTSCRLELLSLPFVLVLNSVGFSPREC